MKPAVEIPGARVWAWPEGRPLRISIADQAGPPVDEAAVEAEWRRMKAANPRLFGGGLLSVVSSSPGEPIVCRRAPYQHLAVQPKINTGVQQLSVTGVVVADDGSGREAVLIGRRGLQTRIYGGMWQLGPAGGLEPPAPSRDRLDEHDIFEALREEAVDELGPGSVIRPERIAALAEDHEAGSLDIVVVCGLDSDPAAAAAVGPVDWEYDTKRWIPLADVAGFDAAMGDQILATSRAQFRFFGWA